MLLLLDLVVEVFKVNGGCNVLNSVGETKSGN